MTSDVFLKMIIHSHPEKVKRHTDVHGIYIENAEKQWYNKVILLSKERKKKENVGDVFKLFFSATRGADNPVFDFVEFTE